METTRRLILSTLLAVPVLAGCGSAAPPPSADPCQFGAAVFDVGPVDFCRQAIALAEAKLGWLHWPITSTAFRGSMCPPGARCAAPGPDQGTVIFTFSVGDPVMILVAHTEGTAGEPLGPIVARDPQPLPDWLLEELRNASQGAGG